MEGRSPAFLPDAGAGPVLIRASGRGGGGGVVPRLCAALLLALVADRAVAEENYAEFWSNPSAELQLDDRTGVELETAQRFRSRTDGGRDTVYLRLWLHRDLAKGLTLSGAVEQRWNEGQEEQRLHQQLSYRRGVWRGRTRLEQRFVEDDARAAVRLRQRFGIEAPLGDRLWSAQANAEGFFTLRTGAPGRQTGLTGLRTYAGLAYEVSDRVTLGLGYVRAQDIRSGRPDRVIHAPLLSLEASF